MAREGESTAEHVKHPGTGFLLVIGVVLLALTTLTYLLHKLPHGSWSLPVALLIAAAKAVLIVLWYMHLLEQRGSNGLVLLTAIIFVAVLAVVTVIETNARFQPTVPPGPFRTEELPGKTDTPLPGALPRLPPSQAVP